MKLEQWRDLLEALRRSGVSRTLRRYVERWLLGEDGAGGAELAAVALQAEGVFLQGRLSDEEILRALLAIGLAEDVLAAREGRSGGAAVWQPSFDMIGRRLAARVALASPGAEARLRELEGWKDAVVGPVLARACGWLDLARACAWTGLGRSPGLFVFENSGKGVVADVCVLVQRGVAGCDGLLLGIRPSRCLLPARLSASSEQAVRLGIVLGLLACEAQRQEPAELRRRRWCWEELLGPAERKEAGAGEVLGHDLARLGQRSALLRDLEAAGTRVEVVLGLGGVEAIEGNSIAVAVAAAAAAAMDDRPGRPLRWDTALTGGLDSRGHLLPVRGLSPKTRACLQSRLVALVGPEPNGPALRELELGLPGPAPMRIRTAVDLLGALEQAALPPATAAEPRSIARTRLKLAAALVLGLGSSVLLLGVGDHSVRPRAPVAMRSSALVTWPSVEWGARISPDGKSVLFLSALNGTTGLWLGHVGAEDFQPVSPPGAGEVSGAVWSPDGREIACLQRDGARVSLQIRPASGGAPRQSVALDLVAPKLVRWLAGGIYLNAGDDSLRRLDPASARLETIFEDARLKAVQGFDVASDELRIVVSASERGQRDLWLVPLDGGAAVPWTRDADAECYPLWVGPEGRGVVYTSEISGIRNLWWLSSEDASKEQLTHGGSEDFAEDAAGDGSFLVLKRVESRAHLRSFDLRTRQQVQLTGDRLQDFWPSLGGGGETLAFQRRKATSLEGAPFTGQLLVAGWNGSELQGARVAVQDGYAPRLSPDGRWLAYLKTPARPKTKPAFTQPEIWIRDLQSEQTTEVGDRFLNSGLSAFPTEWIAQNMVWSRDPPALYFVRSTEAKEPEIRRFQPGASAPAGERIAVLGAPGEAYRDLTLSGDGRWLGYVRVAGRNKERWQVRACNLRSGEDRVVREEEATEAGSELAARGWLDAETLLLLRSTWSSLGWSVEILSAGLDGKSNVRGSTEAAEPATAVFDPVSRVLYLTCLHGAVQDLCGFSMEDGTWTRWSDNRFPGVAFSRPEIAPDGRLLYSAQEISIDLNLIQFQR